MCDYSSDSTKIRALLMQMLKEAEKTGLPYEELSLYIEAKSSTNLDGQTIVIPRGEQE